MLGTIGRTVDDVELLFSALAGPDPRDPLSFLGSVSVEPLRQTGRIAWSRDLGGLPVDPAVTAVLEEQRAVLEDLGYVVVDAEPLFEGADECFEVLRGVTFAGAFKEILHQVKPTLAENVRFGLSLTPERIARAFAFRGEMYARMRVFLEGFDALAAPVCQVPAFPVELEYPEEIAGVRMELLPVVLPVVLADHRHLAPGDGGAGGVHAGRPAGGAPARRAGPRGRRAAGPRAPRVRRDGPDGVDAGAVGGALAFDAAGGRAPRRVRGR